MNNKGIVLIEVIIIIVLLAIITFAITIYLTEGLRFNISTINQEKALYMAQAGIMAAIVDYNSGDELWGYAQNVNVEGEFYYHLGEDANFLWVDASNPEVSGKKLKRIPIKNINDTSSITITGMVVSWDFGGNIKKVKLGGSQVWSGTASSPAILNINDFFIVSGDSHTGASDQEWEFSNNVPANFDVIVTFIFSDSSSRKVVLAQNQRAGNKEFSLKATGEVRSGSNVEARRTLVATYDTGTNKIASWEETQNHIMP